ncbi:ABC transporter substrate-binding protein [Aestuariirhabdus litorea]|uniref:ABC transporter substrate-binding protein n=1 Tax=Aestuariirhabdus litorea TaxID=2528527 RepID=A0A3P3VTW5_9GAMM|nr:ABC transporter substrate-binding protein [Aestuariirhabdus litorea]RRJ84203.1 ABC transporter substrate-binding protein [Aestuariirhabdus litorea]RWW97423.1 extracellular solute-binding protein [Endozoicomonadaceae bacterium GTF-13]
MIRWWAWVALLGAPWVAAAVSDRTTVPTDPVEAFSDPVMSQRLVIFSATDIEAIAPVIAAFEARHPGIKVEYHDYQTNQLDRDLRSGKLKGDVVISSAMDLQTRLVNDGYAQALDIPEAQVMPSWSHWRQEIFGFSFEPVVVAYNRRAFAGRRLPTTHEALANDLRVNQAQYQGRVGTYDIRLSGAGYLFATQDAVVSSISARLQEGLGRASAKLYCCTNDMLDEVADGEIDLAYNLLGSYALARSRADHRLGVLLPEDYTLVITRTAWVPLSAPNPELATEFIRFLLSLAGQQQIADNSELIPLHPDIQGRLAVRNLKGQQELRFQPIGVGAALLVYQDRMKRERFLREWQDAYQPGAAR